MIANGLVPPGTKPHIMKFRQHWFCDGAHGKTARDAYVNWYRSLRLARAVHGVLR